MSPAPPNRRAPTDELPDGEPLSASADTIEFAIEGAGARGSRLDRVVFAHLGAEAVSRSEVKRWIDAGRVSVDGTPGRASSTVRDGQLVVVQPLSRPASRAEADPSVHIDVVFEDDHLLVVNKAAGLVVHPGRGHESGTLVNGLLARGGFALVPDPDDHSALAHVRPGIVHRLDKGTSGLLVVAKTERAREFLKKQFADHSIDREYVAVAIGNTAEATIDTFHGRHPRDRLRFTSKLDSGRRAVTHIAPIERFDGATLVRCRLETGRTHQIRVHLAEQARTPIVGDDLYGKRSNDAELENRQRALGRPALHARVLGFAHPETGTHVRWEQPLPADLKRLVDWLRAERHQAS